MERFVVIFHKSGNVVRVIVYAGNHSEALSLARESRPDLDEYNVSDVQWRSPGL